MKQFKMIQDDSGISAKTTDKSGAEVDTILTGPQPFNNGQVSGYCVLNLDGTTDTNRCFFKSYVEGNPTIFEEIKQAT